MVDLTYFNKSGFEGTYQIWKESSPNDSNETFGRDRWIGEVQEIYRKDLNYLKPKETCRKDEIDNLWKNLKPSKEPLNLLKRFEILRKELPLEKI